MATFEQYANKYQTIRMERRDGILQMTFHQAQELGLVAEVLPRQELLPRAWALAEQLVQQPPLVPALQPCAADPVRQPPDARSAGLWTGARGPRIGRRPHRRPITDKTSASRCDTFFISQAPHALPGPKRSEPPLIADAAVPPCRSRAPSAVRSGWPRQIAGTSGPH